MIIPAICIFYWRPSLYAEKEMTKDRGKRRTPDTVMGELLVQLAQRTNIRKMLTDMDEASDADIIRELLDDFEKILDRRHLEKLLSKNISTEQVCYCIRPESKSPPGAALTIRGGHTGRSPFRRCCGCSGPEVSSCSAGKPETACAPAS